MNSVKSRFDRFKDAIWFKQTKDMAVLIGGCGGIGSWLSLLLNRAGLMPLIFDDDKLEEHNIGGQLMKTRHIGSTKVKAIAEVLSEFTGEQQYHIFSRKIDADSMTNPYSFSAFDNMEARKIMFENWIKDYANDPKAIFIDGRLTAEHYEILCVRSKDKEAIDKYRNEFLFLDSEVEDAPCTLKQTSHMAAMIGAHMCGLFTNHLSNLEVEDNVFEVPFFTSYHLPLNTTTSYNCKDAT